MSSLTLACGGVALNAFDDLNESQLGYAGSVYEQVIGEDKCVACVVSNLYVTIDLQVHVH